MAGDSFSIKAVKGDWDKASKALKDAGTKEMRTAVRKAVSEATKPTRKKIKQATIDTLPHKGGLNRFAARTPSANTDFRADRASIKITMTRKGHDLKSMDAGKVRHPHPRSRKFWYTETVRGGFFTDTIKADGAEIKARIQADLSKYMDELERKVS